MNIIGTGIDIIENERIKKVLEQWPKQFREKVFMPNEIQYCDSKKHSFRHYAARFACKEAAFKAFGVGWGTSMGWLDVEVIRASSGKPKIIFHGRGTSLANDLKIGHSEVAFSHSDDYSVAQVFLMSQ